jgi:tetratricopeptide (TPR) repeat protein
MLAAAAALVLLPAAAAAQDEMTTLRLAQSAEASGDFDAAVRLYRTLNSADPANVVYFDGLRRMLLQVKDYDGAAALLRRRLEQDPRDVSAMAMLGSVEAKAGREREAAATWDQAIALDPQNPVVYRVVAGAMMENRLLERTADLYRRARVTTGDPRLFTLELAQLLAASMEYEGATAEYAAWLRANPAQMGAVQSRMGTYTVKPEGRAAAVKVVRAEIDRKEDRHLEELLAWLHLEGREYEQALDVTRRLDASTGAHGNMLMQFADRAFREGAYDAAAHAYREAIASPVAQPRMPAARYGLARALTESGNLADTAGAVSAFGRMPATESQPQVEGAIGRFRSITEDYPRTEFAARSYYQIGLLQYQRLFDLDGALRSFEQVEREWPSVPALRYDVRLKTGEILAVKGDTARARERWTEVTLAPDAMPDQVDESAFRLAELDYFAGRFPAAIARLSDLGTNLKADIANDAIGLLAFLQENTATAEPALREFAVADLLVRQHRGGEAIVRFREVIARYPQAPLADDAALRVALLQARSGRYDDALATYRGLAERSGEAGIAADRARFGMAEVYQFGLRDSAAAVAAYEKLLADHPSSLLAAESRRRIRQLRGDAVQ